MKDRGSVQETEHGNHKEPTGSTESWGGSYECEFEALGGSILTDSPPPTMLATAHSAITHRWLRVATRIGCQVSWMSIPQGVGRSIVRFTTLLRMDLPPKTLMQKVLMRGLVEGDRQERQGNCPDDKGSILLWERGLDQWPIDRRVCTGGYEEWGGELLVKCSQTVITNSAMGCWRVPEPVTSWWAKTGWGSLQTTRVQGRRFETEGRII